MWSALPTPALPPHTLWSAPPPHTFACREEREGGGGLDGVVEKEAEEAEEDKAAAAAMRVWEEKAEDAVCAWTVWLAVSHSVVYPHTLLSFLIPSHPPESHIALHRSL